MNKLNSLSTKNKIISVALCVLFIVAASFAAFRFSPWHDESYSAVLIERSISGIVKTTANDVHPPFYYIVLKGWSLIFGNSVPILRLSSVLFMLLAVLIIWRTLINEKIITKWPVFVLGVMLFGPFTLRYGFEMRMYALGALLVAIAFWLQMKIIKQKTFSLVNGLGLGFIFALGLYTHYFLSFFVIATAIFTAFLFGFNNLISTSFYKSKTSAPVKTLAVSYFTSVLLFLPWLPTMLSQFGKVTTGGFWIGPLRVETPTSMLLNSTTYLQQWMVTGWAAIALFVVLVSVLYMLYIAYKTVNILPASKYMISVILVPLILLVLISLPPLRSAFQDRYLSFYGSFLYAFIAIGLVQSFTVNRIKLDRFAASVVIVGMIVGVTQVLISGNNQGYDPNPHFMSKEIIKSATGANYSNNVVLVSNDLGYYFDLRVVSKSTGVQNVLYIPAGQQLYRYGNWSALNDREDLLLRSFNDLPSGTKVWFVYNVSQDAPNDDPLKDMPLVDQKKFGYAKINVYEIP